GLEHLGDPAALPALRRATKDPDRTVRRRVIDAIAALQHRDDGSSRRRLASVRLAAREAPRAAPTLFVVLKTSHDRSRGTGPVSGRRARAARVRELLHQALEADAKVTLEEATATELGIEPYGLDVTITRLDRDVSGELVEIACE